MAGHVEHEGPDRGAVHALEATGTHRRKKGSDGATSLLKRDAEGPPAAHDDEETEMDGGEGEPSGYEDCITFVVVIVVITGLLGMFWYLFMQMTSPSELLNQRLQNVPKVEARHLNVHVDLAQLYNGHFTQVDMDRQLVCRQCAGTGVDLTEGFHTCHECKGSGVRTYLQRIGPIQQHVRSACNVCKGRGQVAKKSCGVCHGQGHLRDRKAFDITIERGMRHGDTIVLANEGDQASRVRPGDVVVHVVMHPHAQFARRDDDLELELEISLLEALVGFTREIAHLDGRVVTLKREEIVQPTTVWRIPKLGMPVRGTKDAFGDLLVRFIIQYPTQLTAQDKQRVAELLAA